MTPKDQHQDALYYLIKWEWFSLKDLINDSMFFKFQSRLSTLEKKYGQLARRKRVKFINKFGRKSSYYLYKAIDKNKCLEIFNKLNQK